jgi:hypothetical protein
MNELSSKDSVPISKANQNNKPDYIPSNNYQYQYISRLGCSSDKVLQSAQSGEECRSRGQSLSDQVCQ